MKHRTFITTLLLFLLFFYLGIIIISMAMFKDMIHHAEERSLSEHSFITSALVKDFTAVEQRGAEIEGAINALFQSYRMMAGDKVKLMLTKEAELVYSSQQPIELTSDFASPPQDGSRLLSVRKIDGRTIVIVSGRLPVPYDSYALIHIYDATDAAAAWANTKNMLLLVGFMLSCLLALGLLVVIDRLFKPLSQISKNSRKIAAGAYETRLPENGKDELAEVARNFNHMAEEIQRQMTELKLAAEKKQQFIDNFAHELHTPLTAIYGYAEYLQKAALTEDDRLSALNYIMSESKRLQALAKQLLVLANLKHDSLEWEPLQVAELFEFVKQTMHDKLADRNIKLHFHREFDVIQGDGHLLKSLFLNLADNAMKACEDGGEINMEARIEDGRKTIMIRDNGKGMSPESIEHITEPFYRAEKSRNRHDGGAGLGLAICKQIALRHQAQLEFESRAGEGTTVKIIFTTSS